MRWNAATCFRMTQYSVMMWQLLSCNRERLVLQPSCRFCILTRFLLHVEQCLWCVLLLALKWTVLHQGWIQTDECLVAAEGIQASRGCDHRVTEDRVWEDRVESERWAKKWLLHRGFGTICGNNSCWVSGRFDWRNGLRLAVIGVRFWLLLIACFLFSHLLIWNLDRGQVSLDRHLAVTVHTGASRWPLCCGNDTAGSRETFGRLGSFQSHLFPQRGGEAVEAARHWGWLTLNIQHCDRWTNWNSSLSFVRARFGIPWVRFDCAPWIWRAPYHFPSRPPSDALCTPCEPEVRSEHRIFLLWYKLDVWILTAGDGHGRGFLLVLLLLQCVLGCGGITGWLVGGGGPAWWRLLDWTAAIWPWLIFHAQVELTTALALGSALDTIQHCKEIVFSLTNRGQQSLSITDGSSVISIEINMKQGHDCNLMDLL